MILPQSNPTWSHDSPFKGSRSFHHPKKVTIAELPGTFQIFRYVKLTKLKHHKKKSTSPFQLHLQQGSLDYIILLILILVEIKKCSKKKDMYIYRPRQKNWGFISPQQKKTAISFGVVTVLYIFLRHPGQNAPRNRAGVSWGFGLRDVDGVCEPQSRRRRKNLWVGTDGLTFHGKKMAPYRSWSWKWDS